MTSFRSMSVVRPVNVTTVSLCSEVKKKKLDHVTIVFSALQALAESLVENNK